MRLARKLLYNTDTLKTEMLHSPINEIRLHLQDSLLGRCIQQVMQEVTSFGITLNPTFYLSDSYGCVEGTANIGLGFWDADQLLREIRRDVDDMLRDEGDLLMLLKHEVGHAFCYAYKLYRLKEFRQLFQVEGNFFRSYPEDNSYQPNPFSPDYVNPDYDHYAQKHPDDDFAETFATFIDRNATWRERYRDKPGALKKLQFVGRLIRAHGGRKPLLDTSNQPLHKPVSDLKTTVAEFFHISPRRYLNAAEGFIDPELLQVFARHGRLKSETAAAAKLVVRSRKFIEGVVQRRGGIREPHLVVDLLDKINGRVRALDLVYRQRDEARVLAELLALVLIKARNFALFNTFRNHMS
ncbi:MAG TPA: putative zinc-binding metallopeptidase [Polyangia bacterium]